MREDTVSYRESLKMAWFVIWRGYVFLLAIGLIAGFISRFSGVDPVGIVVYILGFFASLFWALPWFMRLMLRKRFRGFKVELLRES